MPDPVPNPKFLLQAALGRTGECLDTEALAVAAANPEMLPEVQGRHLESCSHCRTELAMLREFESAQPEADELASVQWMESELRSRMPEILNSAPRHLPQAPKVWNPAVWQKLRAWIGSALALAPANRKVASLAAASLLLVLATGVYLRRGADVPHPPAPSTGAVWRSAQFAAISPAGDVAQSPSQFQWEAVPGAAKYRMQLTEVDGTVIWSGETSQTSIGIAGGIRDQLKPGRAFRWQVAAINPAGEKIAATDLQTFHILVTSH